MPAAPPPELELAHRLLGATLNEPVPRSRRIAGLYAALYLEDPLLHQWGGLAAFVARHVYLAMQAANGLYETFMADGNLLIYEATMPAFLRFRARSTASGPLRHGFELLARADQVVRQDRAYGETIADRGLQRLTEVEQVEVVDPAYASLGRGQARSLARLMCFRMGWDTAAPVYDFDGSDPRDPAQRLAWATDEVLPAWRRLRAERPALLRGDLDRVRRWAEVRLDDLPPIPGDPLG